MLLIGIHGRAGAGKDTVAYMLWEARGNFMRLALADPLKRAAQIVFNLSDHETWSREGKEDTLPEWGLSPRQMFQRLGSAVRDLAGPDHWVKRLEHDYRVVKDTNHVVITDIRYENEADWVRAQGGVILHLYREGLQPVAEHTSEHGIAAAEEDYYIRNDSSLEDLRERVHHLLLELESR